MAVTQAVRLATPRLRRFSRSKAWFTAALGGVAFLLAYDKGGYALSSRAVIAITVWWALSLGVGLGLWPRSRVPRSACITASLLAAFAGWTFASIWWAKSAENAFIEFDRAALYLGIFLAAVLVSSRADLGRWVDGLTLAVVATGGVALVSRLFPYLFSLQGVPSFLPNAATRLSFPLGYWNGLGIYVAFAYPLCLRLAVTARRRWAGAIALAPLPAISTVIFLASSRGGAACALVGVLVFLAATERRWAALGAIAVVAIGSAVGVAVLLPRHQLANGPIRSSEAVSQGRVAFFLILAVCLGTAALFTLGAVMLASFRPPRTAGLTLLTGGAVSVVALVALAHPIRRFDNFTRVPGQATAITGSGFVQSHLLSGNGSGRWQFWTAAVQEWKSAPIAGQGAGSYEAWWAQHASFPYFTRNAHSLYLEVLAELGIVGFVLLGGLCLYGSAVAVRRIRRASKGERTTVAALLAVLAVFLVGAGIDWIWQLTAITAVGFVCLGLLTGPATAASQLATDEDHPGRAKPRPSRLALATIGPVVGLLIMCAQGVPWFANLQLSASAAAVQHGDGASALHHAAEAKNLEPWAASPCLQLSLVEEQLGHLTLARQWIVKAIHRNPIDWRLWLVAARIETKADEIPLARRSLLRAEALNPRSPLLSR